MTSEWHRCVCGAGYRNRGAALQCCSGQRDPQLKFTIRADGSGAELPDEVGGPRTFDVQRRDPDDTVSRLRNAVKQLEAASYNEDDPNVRQDIAWLRKRTSELIDRLEERDSR